MTTTVKARGRKLAGRVKQDDEQPTVWWVPSNTDPGRTYRVQLIDGQWLTCSCPFGQRNANGGKPGCSHAWAVLYREGYTEGDDLT